MTEAEFIAREQSKCDKRLRRMLAHVTRTGFPSSRDADETLYGNHLTEFTGPDARFPFNHFVLSARAKAYLETGVLPDHCVHCYQYVGHKTECPVNPAWQVYDAAANDLARKGLTGAIGDPLPLNMPTEVVELINDDPEAFQVRVKGFAYARAMEGIQ